MSEVTFTFAGKMIPAGLNATHEDVFGKGGFIALTGAAESLTDDSAITTFLNNNVIAERRKVGSLVYISSIEKYYTCTDTSGVWERQKFDGSQYFYGPSAPTASDISLGDKWFNTTVGSEFTYLYTDENQDEFIWVDVDHLGQSEASVKYFYGETPPTGELNLGDKWFNPSVGTEFTYLQIDDNPNNLAWVDIDHVGSDQYVLRTGDTMTGTLTGTDASFSGGITTDKAFRTSLDSSFLDNEFITKSYGDQNYLLGDLSGYSKKTSDKNLITNGNFLVWQRGRQFRYLSDTRLRNQTKKQIGLNYFNVEHNSNFFTPKVHISGRFKAGDYNYGSMFSAAADRWVFGWQNIEDGNPSAPVTGSGFYVYRGFINPEDSQIVKNSKYFCRVSTSPPPSYSENRIEPIYTSPTNIGSIQSLVNPTSPNGLTYGAIVNHLLGDDRPSELSGQTADLRRVTDTQYVSSYFDPYNTCIPITGDTDVPGTRAKLRDDYWAGFSQTISYEDFRSMDFGTENAKDLTLRFYARGNVPGEYYVTFTNAGARTLGASQYPDRGRLYTKGFTIDEPNQWKLYQITCEGDKVNEPSSGLTGCWNYPNKNANWPGLQVNWCVGSAPTFQTENSAWKSIPPNSSNSSHNLAIRTDGSLWAWGLNNSGQLGDGTTTLRYSPVKVGEDTDWESVHTGVQTSLALKTDGYLWTWGVNDRGQLGLGYYGGQNLTPNEVDGGGLTWASASCGAYHTLAIKKDGSLWAWGSNEFGQLGLGISSLSIPTPTRVSPIGVTWNSVSCGYAHTLAIKSDGTLWAWGYNIAGQLGLGDGGPGTQRYSPVQVGEDNDWESISCGYYHTLAIKTDGSLWAWGSNSNGQLGLGYFGSSVLAPEQVLPIGVTWNSVSCGYTHTLAIKTDGSLWAWGSNSNGQLGLGDSGFETNRNTPVQVGQQIWNKVCASNIASFALGVGQNSYLYSWGNNGFGMLGQGDNVDRYDPTLLTLLVSGDDPVPTGSWRYAGEGNVWGSAGQVNLLSATGNYLDIAEVSLVDANYTKEIYFPRSDSEIMSECRKYFFGSYMGQSETNARPYYADGTFADTNLAYYGSTNEVQVPHIPDTIRWPHNGGLYSELFSLNSAVVDVEITRASNLAETAFTRVFNCIASAKSTGVFPNGKSTSAVAQKDDYNINTGTVEYDGSNYTTESVVQAIVTHTGSYFGTPALREGYGWDAATADMVSYFKYPYGCRGFSTPRVVTTIIDYRRGFAHNLNSFLIQYSNAATNLDIFVSGQIWADAEFSYGD